ncbi:hypothetical protein ABW286_15490 [Erwinia papayae]|uniref:Type IV / VI secretion system DotU domain-containing protein n=1 Tax=Erwinia papayae TaxID=206499 RepID=A0ABV3N413_9GAMM
MKSEKYFNRIVFIDTLLSFNGIIPSLSEFQLKLVNLIEQFSKELVSEGQCEQLSDKLCYIICLYFDKHITFRLKANNISWERHLLSRHFYGYDVESGSLSARLEFLLKNSDGKIFDYTRQLLLLISHYPDSDGKIHALLACYPGEPVENSIPHAENKEPESVIFLIPDKPRSRWYGSFIWQSAIGILLLIILWFFCIKYLGGLY